jgi:hypothetical protein
MAVLPALMATLCSKLCDIAHGNARTYASGSVGVAPSSAAKDDNVRAVMLIKFNQGTLLRHRLTVGMVSAIHSHVSAV